MGTGQCVSGCCPACKISAHYIVWWHKNVFRDCMVYCAMQAVEVKTNTTVTRIKGHIGKIPYASCRLFSDASTCFRGTTDRNLCRHVSSGARTFPCGSFGRVPPERENYRTFRLYHHVRLFLFPWHVRAQACTRIDAGTMRSDDVREKGADREMHPITKEDKGYWSGFWPHDLRFLGSTRTLLSRDCFSVGKRRQSRHGRSCAFRFHPA